MGLGLHGGGTGTVKFFAREKARITVTDLRSKRELSPTLQRISRVKGIKYVLGRHRYEDFSRANLIIKNPGVPADSPYIRFAQKKHIPITTDVGIFFDRCPAKIIGLTGTRGKSTTAALLAAFLRKLPGGSRIFLAGNIRKSALSILPRVKERDIVVLELSSFQLEDLAREKKSPPIAAITNLMRDHLNRHKNFKKYFNAKAAIFKYQTPQDYLFINGGDKALGKLARGARSHIVKTKLPPNLKPVVISRLGSHYLQTVGLAVAIAKHLGVGMNPIKRALKKFRPLQGRQQYLGKRQGINFVNDTTATIPDAAVAALTRFGAVCKKNRNRLILIAGGQDKKLVFQPMARAIINYADSCILLPGTATPKIASLLKRKKFAPQRLVVAKNMNEAVAQAWKRARRGDWILLSPGAASFGLFLNEFDRGHQFNQAVTQIASPRLKSTKQENNKRILRAEP